MFPTSLPIRLLLACLPLAACSTIADGADDATDSGADELSSNASPATAGPLPVAFSDVWLSDGTAIYLAVEDEQMFTVGFDPASMVETYRVPSHPSGRLRGLTPHIAIDHRTGVFFAIDLELEDGEGYSSLGAYDTATGAQRWRVDSPFDADQPFLCADSSVCLRTDDQQWVFDVDDGSSDTLDATNRRVLTTTPGGFLATVGPDTDANSNLDFLAGSDDFGFTESWRIAGDDIEQLTGAASTPASGWSATHAADGQATALQFGPAGFGPGVVFGFDRQTGELLWGRSEVYDCVYDEARTDWLIVCPTAPSSPFDTTSIVRLDPSDGRELWSIPLGGAQDPFAIEVVAGARSVSIWRAGTEVAVHDLVTGDRLDDPEAALCEVGGGLVDVAWPWIVQDVEYRAVRHVSICGLDGRVLDRDALVAQGSTADLPTGTTVLMDRDGRPVRVISGG